MNIVYCIPSLEHPGGMERVLTEKANYLSSVCGYNISIITTEGRGELNFPLLNTIKVINFGLDFNVDFGKGILLKMYYHNKKIKLYKKELEAYLKNNRIDICVSLCGKEIEFLSSLKDKSKKIAEIHFSQNFRKLFILSRHSGFFWQIVGDIRTWQLKRATKKLNQLVVLTNQDYFQWRKTHTNVIAIPNPSPFRTEVLANKDSKRVIAVGKLDAQKGFDFLVDSWKIVTEKHPEWKLDIYGKGELCSQLQNQIISLGIENSINLKGGCTDILPKYLEHSIYVMTSRYEGLPMVLIEAMECGLPLVSFDCECGPREVIKDGKNGFLIPLGDISFFANRVCELIESRDMRIEMGIESKKMASAYRINEVMKLWITLFSNI